MKARVSLNLPRSLKKAAEDFAAKDGVSVNQYIALALAEKVGAMGAAEFFAERGKDGDADWAVAFLEGRPE
ncbi:MAG: toxin-antitoxin system HicB family antitoxin [Exiguobacterium profundum]|nr:MAG: toxin-antitoxin system HicB family antitoxin [Exiguobacterium profundum]